jgi:hypothetical protein
LGVPRFWHAGRLCCRFDARQAARLVFSQAGVLPVGRDAFGDALQEYRLSIGRIFAEQGLCDSFVETLIFRSNNHFDSPVLAVDIKRSAALWRSALSIRRCEIRPQLRSATGLAIELIDGLFVETWL